MPQMRRLVVAELLRPHDALQLRVEVGEEVGVAEQHPVEENDVVDLHGAEDAQEASEERPEAEAPPDAVPHRQRRRPQEEELSLLQPDPSPSPEETLLQKERAQALRRALNALNRRDYQLFYRKYYYLQSTQRIADELGTTPRAVEGRLYRIRKKLQDQLGGEWK